MKKNCILILLLTVCKLILSAQYYDPSTVMLNQMLNNMNAQLNEQMINQMNQCTKALIDAQEKQIKQYDKNSRASILYLPANDSFSAFITYFGGSPVKIIYVSPMDTRKTLSPKNDYYFAQGSILVTCKLKPGSSLRVYNTGTGKLLANKSIPKQGSAEFESFCIESRNNCVRVANILYGTAVANMNNVNNNPSSSSTIPSSSGKKVCSFCGGKKWYPACSSPTYNMEEKYCPTCKRTVPSSHSHDRCPSCGGTGYTH